MRQDKNLLNGASAWRCASFPMRIVKVLDWDAPLHELIVVHGEDTVQFNTR